MPNDTDRTDLFGGIALVIATFVAREVANYRPWPALQCAAAVTGEIRIGPIGLVWITGLTTA
jgi:hypothetical protein